MAEYRKDVMIYELNSERRLYQVVIVLKNKPGAMAEAAQLLAKAGLNVLSSFTSAGSKDEYGHWGLFAESDGKSADEISKLLRSSSSVKEVIVKEGKEGLIVEDLHFPLVWNTGARAVLMRAEVLGGMMLRMKKVFGTGADVFLYEEGRALGAASGETLKSLPAGWADRRLEDLLRVLQAMGWFRILAFTRSGKEVSVRVGESFECFKAPKTGKPNSHLVRGTLASWAGSILGEELKCEEVKCVAAGDEYCEFVLSPASHP